MHAGGPAVHTAGPGMHSGGFHSTASGGGVPRVSGSSSGSTWNGNHSGGSWNGNNNWHGDNHHDGDHHHHDDGSFYFSFGYPYYWPYYAYGYPYYYPYYYPGYAYSPYYGYYGYDDGSYARPNYAVSGALSGAALGGAIGSIDHHGWEGAGIGAAAGLVLGGIAEASARSHERAVAGAQANYVANAPVAGDPPDPPATQPAQSSPVVYRPASAMSSANSLFGR